MYLVSPRIAFLSFVFLIIYLGSHRYVRGCGKSYGTITVPNCSLPTPFILGGNIAKIKTWPWQGILTTLLENGSNIDCGVAILSPKYVLTAAHCLAKQNVISTKIYAGFLSWPIFVDAVPATAQKTSIDNVTIHKDFNKTGKLEHDIAVIKLLDDFNFTDAINAICLPSENDILRTNEGCYAAGWGLTGAPVEPNVHELKEICLQIVNTTKCLEMYSSENYTLPDTVICAGNTHILEGPRKGDSGGGFACLKNNIWKLFGIISFTPRNSSVLKPIGFTSIQKDLEFIRNITHL